MAIANIFENIISAKTRIAQLTCNITNNQALKRLALATEGELGTDLARQKEEIREHYKDLYDENDEWQEMYECVDDVEDFCAEIDKLEANYYADLKELSLWEQNIDADITTDTTEKNELQLQVQNNQEALNTEIKSDFSFGLK